MPDVSQCLLCMFISHLVKMDECGVVMVWFRQFYVEYEYLAKVHVPTLAGKGSKNICCCHMKILITREELFVHNEKALSLL